MKTAKIGQQVRQGDLLLSPVADLPPGAEIQEDHGIHIVGERTGHAHTLVGTVAVLAGRTYVRGGDVLTHQEHEHIATAPTWYEVTMQREYVPASRPVRHTLRD